MGYAIPIFHAFINHVLIIFTYYLFYFLNIVGLYSMEKFRVSEFFLLYLFHKSAEFGTEDDWIKLIFKKLCILIKKTIVKFYKRGD